ncbi:MAG: carboxypeptidase regulatory-like domain-containing protein [Planctomycetia bacterium]|nr:carboxypeptidase regulatory-like domain-containing protein [Planctomycetia bacterium]
MWQKQIGIIRCAMFLGFIGMIFHASVGIGNTLGNAGEFRAIAAEESTPTLTPGTPTPTPTPGEVGNIAGQVTGVDTGAGINGATVTVVGTGLSGTTTSVQGQDGVYAIQNVPVGAQTLVAEAAGYASSAQDVTVATGNPDTQTGANIFRLALNTEGTPTPSPTPESCVPVKMTGSPKPLKIVKEQSAEETITVVCNVKDDLRAVNRLVQATITGGKKRITVSPASALTDANGEAKFIITATTKTGHAKIKFQDAGRKDVKVNIGVKVKNK